MKGDIYILGTQVQSDSGNLPPPLPIYTPGGLWPIALTCYPGFYGKISQKLLFWRFSSGSLTSTQTHPSSHQQTSHLKKVKKLAHQHNSTHTNTHPCSHQQAYHLKKVKKLAHQHKSTHTNTNTHSFKRNGSTISLDYLI